LKGLLADADELLIGLQNGLSQQQESLTSFVEQQHEVYHDAN
jgi:kinesin family protein 11